MADKRQTQLQLNFNGGQVSESFTPRVDMARYLTSCSRMRNFIPRQYGKLERRPGFKMVDSIKHPSRIFYFPCTSNETYIVCVHSGIDLNNTNEPFCTIYQCGYLGDPSKVWTARLSLRGEPAKNGWTNSFTEEELNEAKYVSQNDKLWIVQQNHFPIVLTRALDDKGNIIFTLSNVEFLSWPLSDENLDSFYDIGNNQINNLRFFARSQSDFPNIAFDAPAVGFAANKPLCDIPFLYDTYYSAVSIKEWIGDFKNGDIICADVRTRTTDGFYPGSIFNWTATGLDRGQMAVNICFRYVYGDWKIDAQKELDSSWGYYVSSLEPGLVHQGYIAGSTIAQIQNLGQAAKRRVTITGSAPNGYFLGFAFTGNSANIRTDEVALGTNVELVSSTSPYVYSVPFAVYSNQKGISTKTDSTVFRNVNYLPYAYAPDRNDIFVNFAANYIYSNYYIAPYVTSIGTVYAYFFSNLTKSAFNVQKGYPSSITLRRGRLILAGTKAQPQTIWASRVDRYYDFSVNEQADSGWNLTIGANQAQQIKWLSSSKDLIVGTDLGEWVINDDDISNPVPTIKEQSRWGSSTYQGDLMTESLFFIPKDRKCLIHSIYSFQIDGYQSEDVSIVASDLIESGITSQTIMKDPDPVWWGTTGDGKMVGFLFNRTQEIQGWHWHDVQGMEFQQVKVYYNPITGAEGVCAILKSVTPDGGDSLLPDYQYYIAFMEFGNPCVDFPQRGTSWINENFSGAGFMGTWRQFATAEAVQGQQQLFDAFLANSFCYQTGAPGELHPYPGKSPKLDIITAGEEGGPEENIITGYCWSFTGDLDYSNSYYAANGVLTGGRLYFTPKFEAGNSVLTTYVGESSSLSHQIWGLHIESEFVSLPMGNTANYIIPAMTTKINQLRYQVRRDDTNDIPPDERVMSSAGVAYGKPRIQAQVEALDFSAPLNLNNNDTFDLKVYLNNGRGHEVLSGPSSTDTRLRFALTDAKQTDILSAYIIYDTDLV